MFTLLEDVRKEVGWDSAFTFPIANAENKRLELEVQQSMASAADLKLDLEENAGRIEVLKQHTLRVEQELAQQQLLVFAVRDQLQAELDLAKVTERRNSRITQENANISHDIEVTGNRLEELQKSIYASAHRVEELKQQLRWNQEAIDVWLQEVATHEEDVQAVLKYQHDDDNRLKLMDLELLRMRDNLRQLREEVEAASLELNSQQMSLDKVAEELRLSHQERRLVLTQWEATLDDLRNRDREVEVITEEIEKINAEIRELQQSIARKEEMLHAEVNFCKEIAYEITEKEKEFIQVKAKLTKLEGSQTDLKREHAAADSSIIRHDTEIKKSAKAIRRLMDTMEEEKVKLSMLDAQVAEHREQLAQMAELSRNYKEEEVVMGRLMDEEIRHAEEINKDKIHIADMLSECKLKTGHMEEEERLLDHEMDASRMAIHNVELRIKGKENDLMVQEGAIYKMDLKIYQTERAVEELMGLAGDSFDEERAEHEAMMVEMEKQISDLAEKERSIARDLTAIEVENETMDLKLVRERERLAKEEVVVQELHLRKERTEKEVGTLKARKAGLTVEEHVMMLQLKQAKEIVAGRRKEVYSLEKQRMEMEKSMQEREQEIAMHQGVLTAQKRALEEEVRALRIELNEHDARNLQLKKRYEIIMASMGAGGGEHGTLGGPDEGKSYAYYLIKAAQEKEELQRKGDAVDRQIRKVEWELQLLENTVKKVYGANKIARGSLLGKFESLTGADGGDQAVELERSYSDLVVEYKERRKESLSVQNSLQEYEAALANVSEEMKQLELRCKSCQDELLYLKKELYSQGDKEKRVARQVKRLQFELQDMIGPKQLSLIELSLSLRERKESNSAALGVLLDVSDGRPEILEMINSLVKDFGLKLSGSHLSVATASRVSLTERSSGRSEPSSGGNATPASTSSPVAVSITRTRPPSAQSIPSSAEYPELILQGSSHKPSVNRLGEPLPKAPSEDQPQDLPKDPPQDPPKDPPQDPPERDTN